MSRFASNAEASPKCRGFPRMSGFDPKSGFVPMSRFPPMSRFLPISPIRHLSPTGPLRPHWGNFTFKISSMYGDPGPLSLLPSGLGIGVCDSIRGVSMIFVFPIFPPIYGLQIFIETRHWLSKDRKRSFEIVSPFSHNLQ